jgi:hypothetical protein
MVAASNSFFIDFSLEFLRLTLEVRLHQCSFKT